ncbi:hypothetical protein [Candidatus Palauibacter sp.]|uniref:hypothetical protein n=1 Tax=Candidatus Palauibacter sp. TaxID=3101350 RepID=UPI003B528537
MDAFEALGIDRSPLPVRVYLGATGGARRYFPRGMPVALDSRRAVFVHADSGYDTSTALHYVAGSAPEALGGAAGGWIVSRGRRGRGHPETA